MAAHTPSFNAPPPAAAGTQPLPGRIATASSIENGSYTPGHAIDGNPNTRWSSEFADPQWITIDFGATVDIGRVVLHWEVAHARAYQIQVSTDGAAWATVFQTATADGGVDDIAGLGARGRYVRMYGTARGTQWGYSLWEFQVFGDTGGTAPGPASTPFGGTPLPLPGTIQAENFDDGGQGVAYHDNSAGNAGGAYRATDVDIAAAADAGGGYTLGWVSAGEWLNYTVNVESAGSYDLEFRVASAGTGGTFHIEVNGVDKTSLLNVPNTGGWQTWTTIRKPGVSLSAGLQVWRVVMISNGATTSAVGNFNWIRVAPASSAVSLLRTPYLQHVTQNSAVVVWTTREAGMGEVRHVRPGGAVVTTPAHLRPFPAAYTGLGHDFYQYEAYLTGLTPATRYTYEVRVSGADLAVGPSTLTTAPLTGQGAVRFIAFGDSGVGSNAQRQLAALMTADAFDLAIHAGDVAYGTPTMVGGGSYAQFDEWVFQVYEPWMRTRPFFPSIGNHDDEVDFAQPYRDVFVLPENGASAMFPDHAERYYSFDYGPVHFVALDTERAFQDPVRRQAQLAWLEADLTATRQPWRVVYFHRPPYSAGSHHGSDLAVRQAFAPLFEKHGVQLVVAAHEHNYERSVPWRQFVPDGSAVTYIVTGGGGAALYPSGSAAWTATSRSVHHYVRVSVDTCTLSGEGVAIDGTVFDTFAINRCHHPPADPGQTDVVLYAADVGVMHGNWSRLPSTSGAGNTKMVSEDRGWASPGAPLAAPADYFEASFDAPAGTYAVWLRLRAGADSKFNDSVWVQFSDAVDGGGAPLWRRGTASALLVNLEECYECGMSGWGWQDNAWWLHEQAVVTFAAGGRHTIRVQTREDGVEIDQIVLSPARFFATPPGPSRDDRTVVPK